MLSVLFGATTITMNRGEQETLYRQSRNLRIQQQQHQLEIQEVKSRHHSYGNIHQVSNLHMQSENSRSFNDERGLFGLTTCDDLVLSVLKTPVKDTVTLLGSGVSGQTISPSAYSNGDGTGGVATATTTQTPSPTGYQALKASEEDLLDDVELALNPTSLNIEKQPARPLSFLKKLTSGGKTSRDLSRFEQCQHRRVPTPIRRKNRNRSRPNAKIPTETPPSTDDVIAPDAESCELVEAPPLDPKNVGIPNPYYPIALPIDQAFKAKYVFHHRRGKTFQERMYIFLEHPCGWLCFVYHFSV